MKNTPGLLFFTFISLILLTGCQKEITFEDFNNPDIPVDIPLDAIYYYKATIGGVTYSEVVTPTNDWEAGSGVNGTDEVEIYGGIYHTGGATPLGSTSLTVAKGIMTNYLSATNAQFRAFFNPGEYPYAASSAGDPYAAGNGVIIEWTDPDGAIWSTATGALNQRGSLFKIISVEDDPDGTGRYFIKVKMQFNCRLYKAGSSETKELINGEMVASFGKT